MKLQESVIKLLGFENAKRQDFVKRAFHSFYQDLKDRKVSLKFLNLANLSFWASVFNKKQIDYFNLITDVEDISLSPQEVGFVMKNGISFPQKEQSVEEFFNFIMNQNSICRLIGYHCLKNLNREKTQDFNNYLSLLEKSLVDLEF